VTIALITGVTGQDGTYLAEYLLDIGYEVHGVVRPSSRASSAENLRGSPKLSRSTPTFRLHVGDLLDRGFLSRLISDVRPDEVYNLASQSHVGHSFSIPTYTSQVNGSAVVDLLEIIRATGQPIRFYQASSSEMFGNAATEVQSEATPLRPQSPYAAAKAFAHASVEIYRSAYGLHASSGILFNHESPRRSEEFVTRKVTKAVAEIVAGTRTSLALGNLDASRDWGYAPEYVEMMHQMLQRNSPSDYVIATGKSHTVRQLCELAFSFVGLEWSSYVTSSPSLFRPSEVNVLAGDSSKAARDLNWLPRTEFRELIAIMINADLAALGVGDRVSITK
jgi:GDPmannose 4,6-dehydratase